MADAMKPKKKEALSEKPEVVEVGEVKELAEVEEVKKVKEVKEKKEAPVVEVAETPTAQPSSIRPEKDKVTEDIEEILADDLTDIFLALPADRRPAFKQRGEEVAAAIKEMVDKGKITARKVLKLISDWLKMIPGVNKFFLEQEAKIRTDKVLNYIEKQ
ncbi:MAG: hypothetical protein ABIA47_00390 [bacterium]